MKFFNADVKRPLAFLTAFVDEGNRVVFGLTQSYVENVATGQRTSTCRKRGVCFTCDRAQSSRGLWTIGQT